MRVQVDDRQTIPPSAHVQGLVDNAIGVLNKADQLDAAINEALV